jgi:pilus assembly protein CpaB
MKRTTRLLFVLLLALAVAAAASYAVFRAMSRIAVRQIEVATTPAVVASRSIAVGTLLTKDDVKVVAWPAKAPVPGVFAATEAVLNRGAIVTIAENEPLTETKLAPVGSGGGLPPTIPDGMRAISVRTNEVIGVAGFVVPGTRVDVLVTVRSGGAARDESMSRVVVSNVQVLTAGTRFDQEKARQDGKPIPTTVVTLVVSPDDAEKIALDSNEGQITLTLRNPLDVAPTATQGARMAGLMGVPSAPPEPAPRTPPGRRVQKPVRAPVGEPAPKPYTVEAIRAAKRTEEPIR